MFKRKYRYANRRYGAYNKRYKGGFRKRYSTYSAKALAQKAMNKAMIAAKREIKRKERVVTGLPIDYPAITWPPYLLNDIGADDSDQGRNGTQIWLKNLLMSIQVTRGSDDSRCRLVVVMDTQNHGTGTPNLGEVWEDTSTPTQWLMSPIKWNNPGRYIMFYDECFTLTTNDPMVTKRIYKIINERAQYFGTGQANTMNKMLLFYFGSDQTYAGVGPDPRPRLSFITRVKYSEE